MRRLLAQHDAQTLRRDGPADDLDMDRIRRKLRHFSKAALVGEQKWLDWLTIAASPFTPAKVKHFTLDQRQQALDWIQTPEQE